MYGNAMDFLPPGTTGLAEAFEARVRAMPQAERLQFLGELLAWLRLCALDLLPE